jgi:hypothetical protein
MVHLVPFIKNILFTYRPTFDPSIPVCTYVGRYEIYEDVPDCTYSYSCSLLIYYYDYLLLEIGTYLRIDM